MSCIRESQSCLHQCMHQQQSSPSLRMYAEDGALPEKRAKATVAGLHSIKRTFSSRWPNVSKHSVYKMRGKQSSLHI